MTADQELETALRGWVPIDDKAKTGTLFLLTSEAWIGVMPVLIGCWNDRYEVFVCEDFNIEGDQPTHYREIPQTPDWDLVSPQAEPEDEP